MAAGVGGYRNYGVAEDVFDGLVSDPCRVAWLGSQAAIGSPPAIQERAEQDRARYPGVCGGGVECGPGAHGVTPHDDLVGVDPLEGSCERHRREPIRELLGGSNALAGLAFGVTDEAVVIDQHSEPGVCDVSECLAQSLGQPVEVGPVGGDGKHVDAGWGLANLIVEYLRRCDHD